MSAVGSTGCSCDNELASGQCVRVVDQSGVHGLEGSCCWYCNQRWRALSALAEQTASRTGLNACPEKFVTASIAVTYALQLLFSLSLQIKSH